ncbi:AAA family ATPase [Sulfurimonas sp. SAG-AH-194-I05]|nr:SbcC/MukB-like Walker B domain-containing protein [Sulfurimonas sp. SAG-AH-194-I05]MDF1876037.1 AAA family ATPase [Sulfurimonas sp. SAG-AH-194-I05]
MKIISLTLENLNSIRGKHTIDFKKSFSKHGLFLLTGDTGSGKTTILDAISVALYGETPRLKSKSELEQLLSIGAKDSLAEVTFIVDKVLYKSSWSINVARTGKVGDSKRVLSKYNDTDYDIITSAKKGFNTTIENITNLNFDRFTKTVMLAQGSFDAFLQAEVAEKSSLLEKITGTEIYQKVSVKVFEKHKEAREHLNSLTAKIDETKILQDDEVKEKNTAIENFKKQSTHLLITIKELQNSIKTVENIAKYENEIKKLKEEQTILVLEEDTFKQDDKKLQRALKAKYIYTYIMQEDDVMKDLKEKKVTINVLDENKSIFTSELKELDTKKSNSDVAIVEFKKIQKMKLEAIDSAKELLLKKENIQNTLDINSTQLKQKENTFIDSSKSIEEDTLKKDGLVKSLVKTSEELLSFEAEKKALENNFTSLENERNKIDSDKLFKQKNTLENKIKDSKEFVKLKEESLEQSKVIKNIEVKVEPQVLVSTTLKERIQETLVAIEKLDSLKIAALSIKNYEENRKRLKDNDECPLCGSTEHPYLINMPKFDDTIADDLATAKTSLQSQEKELKENEFSLNETRTALEVAKTKLQSIVHSLKKLNVGENIKLEVLQEELVQLDLTIEKNTLVALRYKKLLKEIESFRKKEQKTKDAKVKLQSDIKLLENTLQNNVQQIDSLKTEIETLRTSVTKATQESVQIKSSIVKLIGSKSVKESIKDLENEEKELLKEKENLQKAEMIINDKFTVTKTTFKNIETTILELEKKQGILKDDIEKLLLDKGFKDKDEVLAEYIKDENQIKALQERKKSFDEKTIKIETLLKSTKENLDLEVKKELTSTKSVEELSLNEKELTLQRDAINKDATVLEEALKQSELIKNEQAKIYKNIETQKKVLAPWEILNDLIGSAKGVSYQKFVQNLTLGHLLSLANKHLTSLSDRYTLTKTNNDKLDISIIDGYYIDKTRGVNTLSGGERFLVSLSLALGLSDLVNDKIKVDSLFLDEGFGTLDEESLTVALNALEKLHSKGKIIGVVSHVALLKERIYAQIQLKKKSGGSSDIEIIS